MLKVYTASYSATYGYGAFDDYEYVIVANTESEALGFALEAEPSSVAKYWNIAELNTSEPGATWIYERSS